MSREMYIQAKRECLSKLGLDPGFFINDDHEIPESEFMNDRKKK